MESTAHGYRLGPEEGEAYWLLGMLEIVKISGATTNGEYGLIEVTVRAGEGSPWHVHPDEDEWFYVLAGEFTVYVGDERLSLPAGSFAFGPKGVPHTFIAETDGAKALIGFQPFLFEGFLHEVGEPATERVLPPPLEAPPDMARLFPSARVTGSRSSVLPARLQATDIARSPAPAPRKDERALDHDARRQPSDGTPRCASSPLA